MTPFPYNRFLSDPEKTYHLAHLERERNEPEYLRTAHPEPKGGQGWLDPEVLPLCDALNELEGVCTIQSCCGHSGLGPDGTGYQHGQLWLRLDELHSRRVDERVGELLAHDVIWHVQKLYSFQGGSEPHEVLDILFHGENKGRMEEVTEVIGDFFRSLVRTAVAA